MSAFAYPSTSVSDPSPTTSATPSPRNSQMTYPGPLTSRFPSSQLAQQLTHQAWENIGLPSLSSTPSSGGAPDADVPADHGTESPILNTENNDAIQDEEFEVIVEQIASVLEYRLAEIVKQRKEAEHDSGRSTPTGGGGSGGMARRLSNDGVNPRRRLSNESLDRARRRFSNEGAVRRRLSNDSHTSAGSAGSNRSAGRMRRRHSTSSADVIYVSPMCRAELREYVRRIGRRYRPCRYHSFRHAAHVTLSANKLLDLLEERMLTPEEYDCCTYIPETEQLYDCASSSSIELDHKFQRELRRLSIASRASSRRGSNVSGGHSQSHSRRGSNVSGATGSNGGEFSSGSRRGSNASGLGGGPAWRRRSSTGTSASYSAHHRRRSSAAGSAAVRRGSMSSIMSVAVSEADVDSILSPSIVSDTSSQQRMRRRMTQEHVRMAQGVNLRPGQAPRRNSTGSSVSGASSANSADGQDPRISTAHARAARRQSLGTNCSSAASSASSIHGRPSGQASTSPEGQGRQRRRHSVHGASRDVWESCSSHGTAAQESQAGGSTTIANDDESSHRDDFDADASFGLADDPDSELKPLPHRSSTFGIATDPVIKFCLVYAALMHDVDHQGIPNRQLSRENHPLALLYNDKSIAEQNSLKVAFSTLMDPRFAELRHTLCPTSEDQFEFRRIVIDLVMCTDIASPERMQITKSKWAEAFGTKAARPSDDGGMRAVSHTPASSSSEAIATVTASRPRLVSLRRNSVGTNPTRQYNRRAKDGGKLGIKRALHLKGSTIEFYSTSGDTDDPEAVEVRLRSSSVLELMMNAADVAHTMQSFENFIKWNKRLYEELHEAYESGRCADGEEDDPSKDWFGNQLGFYEIYILPLARRLRKCGAFAPDAGEAFVQNAKNICRRWEYEGAAITDRMIEEVRREYEERTNGSASAAREASLEKIDEGNRSSMGSSSCASDHSAALKSFDKAEPGK